MGLCESLGLLIGDRHVGIAGVSLNARSCLTRNRPSMFGY
jgi:hypothetical protein